MKKTINILHTLIIRADRYWQELSRKKQKDYTILFFAIYLLLTAFTVLKLWLQPEKKEDPLFMKHIEAVKPLKTHKASVSLIIKNTRNEK